MGTSFNKFFSLFVCLSMAFVACTKPKGDAQGFSGHRETAKIVKAEQIEMKLNADGEYSFSAPAGTISGLDKQPEGVTLMVWNVSKETLNQLSSSTNPTEPIQGQLIGKMTPEKDGSFSATFFIQPSAPYFLITVAATGNVNEVAIPSVKTATETTAAYAELDGGVPRATVSLFPPAQTAANFVQVPADPQIPQDEGSGEGGSLSAPQSPQLPAYVTLTDLGGGSFRATLEPTAEFAQDTFVEEPNSHGNVNFSTSSGIYVGKEPPPGQHPGWRRRGLLAFNYAFIPANAVVTAVSLKLYKSGHFHAKPLTLRLYKVNAFNHATVTFNTQPAFSTLYASTASPVAHGWRTFTGGAAMISDVQSSIASGAQMHLGLQANYDDVHVFNSAEAQSDRPVFEVTYQVP